PGRRPGAALHRRRGVLPGRDRERRPSRGAGGAGRSASGGARARGSLQSHVVPGGARVNSRLAPAAEAAPAVYGAMPSRGFSRALPRALLTLLLAWLVLYPMLVVVADAARGGGDAVAAFVSRSGEWGA